ncbi:MAG: hypothetical protein QOG94_2672 [Solirubrobacteraceae bacterium]|nr:hypothetical protein [Solirubrobacteraceae bacterium]
MLATICVLIVPARPTPCVSSDHAATAEPPVVSVARRPEGKTSGPALGAAMSSGAAHEPSALRRTSFRE